MLYCVTVCSSVCSVLQCVAVCFSVFRCVAEKCVVEGMVEFAHVRLVNERECARELERERDCACV